MGVSNCCVNTAKHFLSQIKLSLDIKSIATSEKVDFCDQRFFLTEMQPEKS